MLRSIALASALAGCTTAHSAFDAGVDELELDAAPDAAVWCTIHDGASVDDERCFDDEAECWSSLREPRAVCLMQ